MATNYPSALDTTSNLPTGTGDNSVTFTVHKDIHNSINAAVLAIETELGLLPKGSYADVVTRLNDTVVLTPGASGQVLKPSADGIGLVYRPFSNTQTHNMTEWQNSGGSATLAYVDKVGNFSAASLAISGTALAATHLSDNADLARIGSANVFTQGQTISAAGGLTLSGNGGATTLAITNTTAGVGLKIGGDVQFTRSGAAVGEFAQQTNFKRAAAGNEALGVFITGDTNRRAYFTADGKLQWTDGSSAFDTNLYRVSASQLQTDYRFNAALDLYARVGGAGETKIGAFGPANEAGITLGSATAFTLYKSGSNAATTTGDINAANLNVTGQFKVGGTQISSANLSDAITGTGSLVKAASPTLSGTPLAPTAAVDTNTTQIATTAFVIGQTYAKLASPTFTGTPAAPTAAAATNTTQIATTAFVTAAIAAASPGTGSITSAMILDGTITDADVAAANKDGAAGTASLRTLGTGAAQAAAGNDSRFSDTRTPTDNTVSTAKLQAGAVTQAKLSIKYDSGKGVSFNGSIAVTFATAFSATPIVIAGQMVGDPNANGGTGEPANYTGSVDSVTSTGFTLIHNQGGTRTVPWLAIGA